MGASRHTDFRASSSTTIQPTDSSRSQLEQELYRQLKQCKAVVFLSSQHSMLSQWCFAELALAISMGKLIFPLRLQGDARHPLLGDYQWTDLSSGGRSRLRALVAWPEASGGRPPRRICSDPARSPYPGLSHFEEQDAAVFLHVRRHKRCTNVYLIASWVAVNDLSQSSVRQAQVNPHSSAPG